MNNKDKLSLKQLRKTITPDIDYAVLRKTLENDNSIKDLLKELCYCSVCCRPVNKINEISKNPFSFGYESKYTILVECHGSREYKSITQRDFYNEIIERINTNSFKNPELKRILFFEEQGLLTRLARSRSDMAKSRRRYRFERHFGSRSKGKVKDYE